MASLAIPQPRRAEKKRVKIKIGVQGPSGSGKTWAALALARNIWPSASICLVDTENESASLYADLWEFDTIPLTPPFTSARYEQCIETAVRLGYDVLIIDSISHQWDGEGGILRRKEELDQRPGANSYTNWSKFTPEHQAFIESIKQAPIHIIATMRAKQDYVLEQSDKGKTKPVKVGMAPIVREGTDYEFSIVFDVQMDHKAVVSKNRTGMFEDEVLDLASQSVADRLKAWLESGAEVKGPAPETWSAPKPRVSDEPQKIRTTNQSTNGAKAPQRKPQGQQLGVFESADDLLTCVPVEAKPMERNGQKFYAVRLNGKVEGGGTMAFCFITRIFGAISNTPGNRTVFRMDYSDYPYITDVLEIAGRPYENGLPKAPKPESADAGTPAQDTPTPTTPDRNSQTNAGGRESPSAVSGETQPGRGESAAAPSGDPLQITDDDLPAEFFAGKEEPARATV